MNKIDAVSYGRELVGGKASSAVIGILFFILATALGAYIRIPLANSPVPITLQTFFVMLSGAVLGKRLGIYSQIGYVLLGGIGLPLFQSFSAGALYLLGPTGGYLFGFIVASYIIGRLLKSGTDSLKRIVIAFIAGDLIVHAIGALWLAYLYGMSMQSAILAGILPFIPGEMLKIFLVTSIYARIARRSKIIFS